MIESFATAFSGTLGAMAAIFLVVVIAGLLVRRGIIGQNQIDGLSTATVNLFLPCLIFSKVLQTLDPVALPRWWVLPLVGILMALVGTGLGALAFLGKLPEKRAMLPLAGMQNAGYLVLPVGLALFPDGFDTFALYCFLFILGYNPVLWSLGKMLVSNGGGGSSGWRGLLTPPLLANLIAIAFALSGAGEVLPGPFLQAVDLLGTAAVPVATLVLGAVLGSIDVRIGRYLGDAARAVAIKLLVLPALTVAVLFVTRLHGSNPLLAEFLVIEAAAAPAVALVLQVRTYGGDEQRVGSVMFLSYLACTVTLPFWVAVWMLLNR
jgi:predicted permease